MAESDKNLFQSETLSIPIEQIGERFAPLRIVEPQAERAMLESMRKYGQMKACLTCRIVSGEHELLDGFKRLRAARLMGLSRLVVRPLDVSLRACKAAMLQLNRVGKAISGMEEALIVHSLHHDDGLTQVEIGALIGRHKSWVSRRLSLIERLSDEVQESIKLGLLPASFGAEMAKLQRSNQDLLLESIRKHRLSWRETRKVVIALQNSLAWEQADILRDPRRVVSGSAEEVLPEPGDEKGLGFKARQIQRKLLQLEVACTEGTLLFSGTQGGQFEEGEQAKLHDGCIRVLENLVSLERELKRSAAEMSPSA